MRGLRSIRRRLGRKLFLSYLIIIVVGVVVLASAAEFTGFERARRSWVPPEMSLA